MSRNITTIRDQYCGIPYTLLFDPTATKQPLLCFFHGFLSNRDLGSMGRVEQFASLGFAVLAIDAYNHGERLSQVFQTSTKSEQYAQILQIVDYTALDIAQLIDEVISLNQAIDTFNISVYGVSMGGMSALLYASRSDRVKKVVTLVSTPNFVDYYQDRQVQYGFKAPLKQNLEHYQEMNPSLHPLRLSNKACFFAVGIHDNVIDPSYTKEFVNDHEELQITFQEYDTGHCSTKAMLQDAQDFLLH